MRYPGLGGETELSMEELQSLRIAGLSSLSKLLWPLRNFGALIADPIGRLRSGTHGAG